MYSPRIYLYKITFEEVPYYYYGVHKEKKYDEKYFGTPITHKWCWEFYTPKKQILQLFDFTDEGWLEAQKLEKRLIKPFYNSDKWCLNEGCGGRFSLKISRENGKKTGNNAYLMGIGIHSQTKEQRCEFGRKLGKWNKENTSKEFSVVSPTGELIVSKNVREFCKMYGLDRRNFIHLLNGTWMQYNGWKLCDETY